MTTSMRLATYAPLLQMPWHEHDSVSLCVVLAGEYEESIRGRSSRGAPGSVFLCPPGMPHAQRFDARGAHKLLISPDDDAIDYLRHHVRLNDAPRLHSPDIARLGARAAVEIGRNDDFSPTVLEGLALEILGSFCRETRQSPGPPPFWLRQAIDYLQSNLAKRISVKDVAAAIDREPAQLSRAFRAALGRTLGEHQRALRASLAADLLRSTAIPLAEVALACGFCDQSHLNRAFKAHFGCTPGAFRRHA